MTAVSKRQPPLGEHRASVRKYLRDVDLPFESVAGAIVQERLAADTEDDLLRSSLALWACRACGGDERDALPIAASLYLFDRFMLLHDELVEDQRMPRWGLGQSLNAGDALYALAFRTLAEDVVNAQRRLEAAALVARAVLESIEGRNVDLERTAHGRDNGLLAQVRSVRRRSAVLTGAAVSAGVIVAGAPEATLRGLDRAGRLLAVLATVNDEHLARRLGEKANRAVARVITDADRRKEFEEVVNYVSP